MNLKSFANIVISSFSSKDLYKEICFTWKKKALKYFFAAIVITSLPSFLSAINFALKIDVDKIAKSEYSDLDEKKDIQNANINDFIAGIISHIPLITIENGIAKTENQEVINIYYPGTDKEIITIDTNPQTNILKTSKATILVTSQELVARDPENENYTKKLLFSDSVKNNQTIVIDRTEILNYMGKIQKISYWVISFFYLPLIVLANFMSVFLRSALYSLIGLLFLKSSNIETIKYNQILMVALISSIPSLAISFIFSLSFMQTITIFKFGKFLVLMASIMYFFFALRACSEKAQTS